MPPSYYLEQMPVYQVLIALLHVSALTIPLMIAIVSFGWKPEGDQNPKPKGGGATDSDEQRAHPLF